jgi:predicted MFS family arabinose efflux permease
VPHDISDPRRERLLEMLAAATFVIFFQGYMVAPIIPTLSSTFGSSIQTVGLIVPATLSLTGSRPSHTAFWRIGSASTA